MLNDGRRNNFHKNIYSRNNLYNIKLEIHKKAAGSFSAIKYIASLDVC